MLFIHFYACFSCIYRLFNPFVADVPALPHAVPHFPFTGSFTALLRNLIVIRQIKMLF